VRVNGPESQTTASSAVTRLAGRTKVLLAEGNTDEAHRCYADLVAIEQRRASRPAPGRSRTPLVNRHDVAPLALDRLSVIVESASAPARLAFPKRFDSQ